MKLLPGRILVVLLALIVGVALGAGLAGALRTPAPSNVEPIHLDGERRDETGEDDTKNKRGKDGKNRGRDKGKEDPPPGNNAPVPQNDPPAGGAPPPPAPPPPANDDDDGGDDSDDGGGDD